MQFNLLVNFAVFTYGFIWSKLYIYFLREHHAKQKKIYAVFLQTLVTSTLSTNLNNNIPQMLHKKCAQNITAQ